MGKFRLDRVEFHFVGERNLTQEFQGRRTRGLEQVFDVRDGNFLRRNKWRFVVFVPDRWLKGAYVSVSPQVVPNRRDWAGLERRSLQFAPCTKHPHRRSCYAKLSFADPTDEQTRIVLSRGEPLPPWFEAFRTTTKHRVATTRAGDGDALVAVVDKTDRERMICLFLALKPWALASGFSRKLAA